MPDASILQSTIIKLAIPAGTVIALLFITRRRGISWREDLGLRAPKPGVFVLWMTVWIGWIAVTEFLITTLGLDQAQPWPSYPILIVMLRILAIGIAGPMSEELVMRGCVLHLLQRTRLGAYGAIALISVAWAALHYSYGIGTILLIVVDGVLFGTARVHSKSLWTPIAMHSLGNLVSIGQSLSG